MLARDDAVSSGTIGISSSMPTDSLLGSTSSTEPLERSASGSSVDRTPPRQLGRASSFRHKLSKTLSLFTSSSSSSQAEKNLDADEKRDDGESNPHRRRSLRLHRSYSTGSAIRPSASLSKRAPKMLLNGSEAHRSQSPESGGKDVSPSPFRRPRAVSDLSMSPGRLGRSPPLSPFGREETYRKLETVGEGSYATVYRGFSSRLNCAVAMKEIVINPEEGMPFTAIREASLLKGLKHANIVTLHDIIHSPSKLTFVFEYVDTDLSRYMDANTGGLPPNEAKLFLFQLIRGLAFCHKRRILHRDLKPQNLLINQNGELKLADFGLARCKSVPSKTYSNEVVTLWYRPPDVLLGSTDYSTSIDMWGVGCIFAEMISGAPLFPGIKDTEDQLLKIWQILGTPNEASWPGVKQLPEFGAHTFPMFVPLDLGVVVPQLRTSHGAEELASLLLQLRPSLRLTAKEALNQEYFSDLPPAVFTLGDEESIFSVPGLVE